MTSSESIPIDQMREIWVSQNFELATLDDVGNDGSDQDVAEDVGGARSCGELGT